MAFTYSTFLNRPSGAEQDKTPKATISSFGDGYEQRQAFGINTNPMLFNLTFASLSLPEGDAIDAFLDARAGVEAFYFTPPNKPQGLYVCDAWHRTWSAEAEGVSTITAAFRQIFE